MPNLQVGDLSIEVQYKRIKNLYLRISPSTGSIRISAPMYVNRKTLREFVQSKLGWIKKQQKKLRNLERNSTKHHLGSNDYSIWGKPYRIHILESLDKPTVFIHKDSLKLQVRPGSDEESKRQVLDKWQRRQVQEAIDPLLKKWETRIGVSVERISIRRMKTLWGSCTPRRRTIRLNLELIHRDPIFLEYVLVHEMMHLLEASHNGNFKRLMDQHMPDWRSHREELKWTPPAAV